MKVVTRQLTSKDIEADETWLTRSVFLVTSNIDRVLFNGCMAKTLAKRSGNCCFGGEKRFKEVLQAVYKRFSIMKTYNLNSLAILL